MDRGIYFFQIIQHRQRFRRYRRTYIDATHLNKGPELLSCPPTRGARDPWALSHSTTPPPRQSQRQSYGVVFTTRAVRVHDIKSFYQRFLFLFPSYSASPRRREPARGSATLRSFFRCCAFFSRSSFYRHLLLVSVAGRIHPAIPLRVQVPPAGKTVFFSRFFKYCRPEKTLKGEEEEEDEEKEGDKKKKKGHRKYIGGRSLRRLKKKMKTVFFYVNV